MGRVRSGQKENLVRQTCRSLLEISGFSVPIDVASCSDDSPLGSKETDVFAATWKFARSPWPQLAHSLHNQVHATGRNERGVAGTGAMLRPVLRLVLNGLGGFSTHA